MSTSASLFVAESRRYLRDVYLPRLEQAVAILPASDLWWQPHEGALNVGTILRHLQGNVRQWIVAALGGAPDQRDRPGEFAPGAGPDGTILMARLRETVQAAHEVLGGLDEAALLERRTIQGFEMTVLEALYHVVEHFSWHVGQAVWIAKARRGPQHGVAFYDETSINAAKNG